MNVLGSLYGRLAQLRRAWYRRHPHRAQHLELPVISVGNLVMGGSGKTPVVAMLARLLCAAGERPAILSRGYGRRRGSNEVVVVSDGLAMLAPVSESGDEPQMLARALTGVPVLVSAERFLAARLAERRFGCSVHLLDDGFQHVQLARDIDLLVMSRADLDERVLPWGRLREPLEAGSAADALLVSGSEEDAAAITARVRIDPVFRIVPRYQTPRLIEPLGGALPAAIGTRAVAVAGIARPERVFAALRAQGWEVVREVVFRDHHWFTERDLAAIRQAAVDERADLVLTTEKDAMRLPSGLDQGGIPWAFLPMEVSIQPADQFAAWITERLAAAREGRPPQRMVKPALAGRVATRPLDVARGGPLDVARGGPDPSEGGEAS